MEAYAKNFVETYYATLDNGASRPNLRAVYRDGSVMCFEGQTFEGPDNILKKLESLPQNMVRAYTALDVLMLDSYLLVNVLGQQKTDQDHPLGFTHTFILTQMQDTIVVVKEIFRLTLHNL